MPKVLVPYMSIIGSQIPCQNHASIAQLGEHSTEGISCALVVIERSPVRSGVEALFFDLWLGFSSRIVVLLSGWALAVGLSCYSPWLSPICRFVDNSSVNYEPNQSAEPSGPPGGLRVVTGAGNSE